MSDSSPTFISPLESPLLLSTYPGAPLSLLRSTFLTSVLSVPTRFGTACQARNAHRSHGNRSVPCSIDREADCSRSWVIICMLIPPPMKGSMFMAVMEHHPNFSVSMAWCCAIISMNHIRCFCQVSACIRDRYHPMPPFCPISPQFKENGVMRILVIPCLQP